MAAITTVAPITEPTTEPAITPAGVDDDDDGEASGVARVVVTMTFLISDEVVWV